MTTVPLEHADVSPTHAGVVKAVFPSDGSWWWLHSINRLDGEHVTLRTKVVAWAWVSRDDGFEHVEPMIPNDSGGAGLVADVFTAGFSDRWDDQRLFHDGESWCHCRDYPHSRHETDDIWWCTSCAGVIPGACE